MPKAEELVLWTHPDDPTKRITVNNGIVSFIDLGHHLISLEELWQQQTSQEEPRVEIPFGHVFHGDSGSKEFHYAEIQAGLEEIIGCELTHAVRMGFDNFFHYVFQRQFRQWDRQRLKAEQVVTFMQGWEVAMGSYVVVRTGRIEVVCRTFPEEQRKKGD